MENTYNKLLTTFKSGCLNGKVLCDTNQQLCLLDGVCENPSVKFVSYLAGAPPTSTISYSGSGLPFPTEEHAYSANVSTGEIAVDNAGRFQIAFPRPNSYYISCGKDLIVPHIMLRVMPVGEKHVVKLGEPIPNRSLTSLPNKPNRSTGR